jgi:hypothetical protein
VELVNAEVLEEKSPLLTKSQSAPQPLGLTKLVAVCSLVAGLSLVSWGQATVNEGLETASIYVDGSKGSDSNNGSKTAPLKTIGASVTMALNNNHANIGSKVIINPGIYREAVVLDGSKKSTSLPITFQAATNGTALVSGSELITGWSVYSGNSKIYETSWPYNFGVCAAQTAGAPAQQEIILHVEMLLVNGTPLTQVLTLSSMLPGTFYVDEAHKEIYAYPPAGVNMSSATVETATLPNLLTVSGQSNVVFRGLTFQYANSCPQSAAVMVGGNITNILFDTDNFLWNNAIGIEFTTVEEFTVQNSVANYNGQIGLASHEVKNSLWQSNTANYNNWRGAQGAFYTWDTGGTKWMWDHNGAYQNMVSNFNLANGVAWDTDNENVTFTTGVSDFNLVNSIQIEKTQGPFTISNSHFCYSNLLNIGQRGGVAVRNSEQLSVTGTTMYDSLVNQLVVLGQPGGIEITNWETGQSYNLITEKFTSSGNVFNSAATSVISDSYLGGSDWTTFVNSLKSNSNTFYGGTDTTAFVVPTPKTGTDLTLANWQSETGQDKSSAWKSTSAPAACNVAAQTKDFWIVSSTYAGATISKQQAVIEIGTFGFGGIAGNVALSLDGVSEIKGLSAKFSPATIPVTGASALTVTASSSTPPGAYPITILGNLGNITHTVTISLVVP